MNYSLAALALLAFGHAAIAEDVPVKKTGCACCVGGPCTCGPDCACQFVGLAQDRKKAIVEADKKAAPAKGRWVLYSDGWLYWCADGCETEIQQSAPRRILPGRQLRGGRRGGCAG